MLTFHVSKMSDSTPDRPVKKQRTDIISILQSEVSTDVHHEVLTSPSKSSQLNICCTPPPKGRSDSPPNHVDKTEAWVAASRACKRKRMTQPCESPQMTDEISTPRDSEFRIHSNSRQLEMHARRFVKVRRGIWSESRSLPIFPSLSSLMGQEPE